MKSLIKNKYWFFVLMFWFITKASAQLGFCTGNSGDPIFTEDFGISPSTARENIPLPPPGTTTYNLLPANLIFADGQYVVSNSSDYWNWFHMEDHTQGDINGRMLIVNASFTAGEFFRIPINGLCENTTYEFSSWLVNLTPRNDVNNGNLPNPCNVRFEIWDSTDTVLLRSGDTGDFFGSLLNDPGEWVEYGMVVQTQPGQTSVILKMVNNGVGGYGNDLAIDDIVFKSCGDDVNVEDNSNNNSINLCSGETPYSTTLTAIPDNSVFSSHFYQWQESTDGNTWVDITGETNSTLSITGLVTTTYYRAKIAEDIVNVNNSNCNAVSDVYEIIVTQAPPAPTNMECWETATLNNATCTWEITGAQPVAPANLECWETIAFNNTTCTWDVTGTQPTQPSIECWETATFNNTTCVWDVTGTQPSQPNIECWETATFNNTSCVWDITGTQPTAPSNLECWETATFNNSTCTWDITGTQPTQPNLECWEIAVFNNTTCVWDITGTQSAPPTNLACWEVVSFNNTTCSWDVTGTQPQQPSLNCWESANFNTSTCSWDITGTQPTQPSIECWETAAFNNTTCSWDITGTQPLAPTNLECWETATFNNATCVWDVTGTQPLDYVDMNVELCEGQSIALFPNINFTNPSYVWDSGETTNFLVVDAPGDYSVEVSDNTCATTVVTFHVTQLNIPLIESVESDGNDIIITTSNTGDFLYSIDGNIFTANNVFSNIDGGLYTIHVRQTNCSNVAFATHLHFYIPKFFTPNGDGFNDTFDLKGIEYFNYSQVTIFDRYGKLLKNAVNTPFSWNGTLNNQELPSDDYWYIVVIDDQKLTGHFTLKR